MSNLVVSKLKEKIDSIFGKNSWFDYEPETIAYELGENGYEINDLLLDKINVIRSICLDPELFYEDFWFTLIATDVINNQVADFTTVPSITSLELAFAITEVQKIIVSSNELPKYSDGFIEGIAAILRNEGYSKPVAPFGFVPADLLHPGQTDNDTKDKEKAIQLYIKGMLND